MPVELKCKWRGCISRIWILRFSTQIYLQHSSWAESAHFSLEFISDSRRQEAVKSGHCPPSYPLINIKMCPTQSLHMEEANAHYSLLIPPQCEEEAPIQTRTSRWTVQFRGGCCEWHSYSSSARSWLIGFQVKCDCDNNMKWLSEVPIPLRRILFQYVQRRVTNHRKSSSSFMDRSPFLCPFKCDERFNGQFRVRSCSPWSGFDSVSTSSAALYTCTQHKMFAYRLSYHKVGR